MTDKRWKWAANIFHLPSTPLYLPPFPLLGPTTSSPDLGLEASQVQHCQSEARNLSVSYNDKIGNLFQERNIWTDLEKKIT